MPQTIALSKRPLTTSIKTQKLSATTPAGAHPSVHPSSPTKNPGLTQIKQKLRERWEAFSQETTWSTREPGINCKSPSKQQRGPPPKNLKDIISTTTHSMWHGIKSVTNYRKTTTITDPRDTTFLDSLHFFYARFDRLNTNTPSKAPCDPMDSAFQVTQTQVPSRSPSHLQNLHHHTSPQNIRHSHPK